MEIAITNYRNIRDLDIAIEDGKVNFLLGVCGSGKSSILDAISKPVAATDVRVGCNQADTRVAINGEQPNYEGTAVYNLDRQGALFRSEPTSDSYEIFVGDEAELQKLEASYNASIEQLRSVRERLFAFVGRVDQVIKAVKKPGARGYTAKSSLGKARAAVAAASPETKRHIKGKELAYLDWRDKGFAINDDFERGICPFCGQTIDDDLSTELSSIRELALKDMKPLFQVRPVLAELGCEIPDVSDEGQFNEFKDALAKLFAAQEEINKVLEYINIAQGTTLLEAMPEALEVDSVAFEYVPELKPIVDDVKARKDELAKRIGQMRGALTRLVEGNVKQLNRQLDMLGIPYSFSMNGTNRTAHTASYILKHIGSVSDADMRGSLSYGEKNLIALVLFLHNNESHLTLIDDPASSYDDFRRSQIYNCIMRQKGKTVLVVSHDQAFMRRAVRETNKDRLGTVSFLENTSKGCAVKQITKDSFVFIDDEIRRRIAASTTYFQKVVNTRLFCDIHKEDLGEVVWGYTSALLHGTSKSEVLELLRAQNTDEQGVLQELKQKTGTELECMPDSFNTQLTDNFSDYEVLIYMREAYRSRKKDSRLSPEDKVMLEMLNDLVHMNDCALHCLNPYEYAVWPARLSEVADSARNKEGLSS